MGIKNDLVTMSCTSNCMDLVSECEYCGIVFPSKRSNKYCSNSCRQRAYYVRNGLRRNTGKSSDNDHYTLASSRILEKYKSKILAGLMEVKKKRKTRENKSNKSVSNKKVDALEMQLLRSELKVAALEEMINIAEYYFNIAIRKKSGAKQ